MPPARYLYSSMKRYTSENRTTVNWASGTSTEIFIYPASGSFADRDFTFRISTATVEAEESTFSFFEGITRHLMILKGHLELTHEGRYTKHLQPFDQDTFFGEWPTKAKGKVTDFNLMLKGGAEGSLTHRHVQAGDKVTLAGDSEFSFIYIVSGRYVIAKSETAGAGDLVQLDGNYASAVSCIEGGDIIEIGVVCVR